MFRNKPTAKNKGKIPVFIRRGVSPKKMFTASSGIFNLEKVQKTRATGTATPARVESQHAKVSDRVFSAGDNGLSMLEAYSEEKKDKDQTVREILMGTIDDLRRELEVTKRRSDASINELRQQKKLLKEKLESKNHEELPELKKLKTENLRLKNKLMDKISELDKLREKLSSGESKHVQTTEIISSSEMKETQFIETLTEFGWIEKLLLENIADSERISAELSVTEEATKKCVGVNLK